MRSATSYKDANGNLLRVHPYAFTGTEPVNPARIACSGVSDEAAHEQSAPHRVPDAGGRRDRAAAGDGDQSQLRPSLNLSLFPPGRLCRHRRLQRCQRRESGSRRCDCGSYGGAGHRRYGIGSPGGGQHAAFPALCAAAPVRHGPVRYSTCWRRSTSRSPRWTVAPRLAAAAASRVTTR